MTTSNNIVYGVRLAHDLSFEYRYVGLTTRGQSRFTDHMWSYRDTSSTKPLYAWMRKHYGAVVFDVLDETDDPDQLALIEMKWIHVLRSRGYRLLNLTDGGYGTQGYGTVAHAEGYTPRVYGPVSEETRERMRQAKLGVPRSEATRKKISVFNKGKVISEKHKEILRSSKLGENNPMYGKPAWNTGKKMSDIVDDYVNPNKGRVYSDEHRKRLSEVHTGLPNKGRHTRWHVNRGVSSPDCSFCSDKDVI